MSRDSVPVTVRILEKEFCVTCPAEEHDSLLASARYLDGKMRQMRDSRKAMKNLQEIDFDPRGPHAARTAE